MFPVSNSRFINSDKKANVSETWYWGINKDRDVNSPCYLLEMVLDSLNVDSMKSYRRFIKKNITDLCLEVGNLSDFFEQLNYIIHTDRSRESKIEEIMNLQDHQGGRFIDQPIAELIYKAMTMNYVKKSVSKKYGGSKSKSKSKSELNERCYRQISKGRLGYSVKKCGNNDASSCDNKAVGCKKANCSIEDPDYPGYYQNISDMKEKLYKKYQVTGTKTTSVLEGVCQDKKLKPAFKLSKFDNDGCDLRDLNELCNYYEANPDGIDGYLNEKLTQYNSSGRNTCRQMMGEFNKKLQGKSAKKHCKAVKKDLERKQKKMPILDESQIYPPPPPPQTPVPPPPPISNYTPSSQPVMSKHISHPYQQSRSVDQSDDYGVPYDASLHGTPDDDDDDKTTRESPFQERKSTFPKIDLPNKVSSDKFSSQIKKIPSPHKQYREVTDKFNNNIGNIASNINNLDQKQVLDGIEIGLKSLGDKLGNQLCNFNQKSNTEARSAIDALTSSYPDNKGTTSLASLPKLIFPALFYEFNIPLNINDVLLIGFSVFPYIGWVFDIFMIFRALLERRWLYAILMVINWYQWFFWKVLTFGMANVDLGPLFKLFYLGPYASKYFNFSNLTSTFIHFFNEITGNMPKMISITN